MADPGRSELGEFLRSRREKLNPRAVGLPGGSRRRTAGLRRQEVAELAGIGVDWYVRLEQGRAINPSSTTVDALARALRLSRVEHGHLRALARKPDRRAFVRESVPGPLRHLVESLNQPAYVTGRRWDILAWNEAAVGIFGDFGRIPEAKRNILLWVLTDPGARRLFGANWTEEAKRIVAQFRTTHDLWAGDPTFDGLLEQIRLGCREFATWWEEYDVRVGGAGCKLLEHPTRGVLRFDYSTFQVNDDPSLKLAIYALAGPVG